MKCTILLAAMILCCAAGPSHANSIFLDDFNDQASADPPGGWTRTQGIGTSVSLETSSTSSVELSNLTNGTTRIFSTGLPTFNVQANPPITLTVDIAAIDGGATNFTLGGISNGTALVDSFFVQISGDGGLQARSTRSSASSGIALTTLAGYTGGPVTISAMLSGAGYRVSTDFGSFDSGLQAWSTMDNGFDLAGLGPSTMAFLQITDISSDGGATDFDLISVEETLETLPGDFDLDGDVDGEDFLLWQRDPSVGPLADWEANYGAPLSAPSAAVPEPTTSALALAALCLAMGRRRSH